MRQVVCLFVYLFVCLFLSGFKKDPKIVLEMGCKFVSYLVSVSGGGQNFLPYRLAIMFTFLIIKVFRKPFPHKLLIQINEHTPWIDGGIIYGTTKAWADNLRSFKGGRLADNGQEGEPQFPERNTIGLPMANPPNPVEHKYSNAKRYFSKSKSEYVTNMFHETGFVQSACRA